MLSLPNDGRYSTLELDPQQRRQKTLEALTAQLQALAQATPVLMIFEDVHWIDPTSLEAVGRTVERLRTLRVLLIVTYRPEFEPQWVGRPYVTALALNRLGEREITAMIDRVTGNKALPENIRQDIIERTDGVPLFVEEITKAVLEAENEGEAQRTVATVPSSTSAVPASLHASLMARLDRLGPAKEVAQIGSTIGREFSHSLLAAVARKSEIELGSALDRLIGAGLLFRQGVPPHAAYLFKHALVQDAAYGTLLREPRRALHARIAETLESGFAEIAENQPELLARHYTEAGKIEKAADLWGKAGQRSLERSALVEALGQLTRALTQIASLPSTPLRRRQQIEFQVALINPFYHIKGPAAPETKAAAEQARVLIERAEALGEPVEDPLLVLSALYGCWVSTLNAFDGDAVNKLATQFLALAKKQGTTVPLMTGNRLVGNSLLLIGNIAEGRAHLDQAFALYDPVQHRPLAMRFGQEIGVAIQCFRSLALWSLGYPEAARTDADQALHAAREIGQAATLAFALCVASFAQIFCGHYARTNTQLNEADALATEMGSVFWKAFSTSLHGCASAWSGEPAEAVHMITAGIIAFRSTGTTLWMPLWLSYLAGAYGALGQFDDAWCSIREAMTAIETTKERWCEAEANRIAGEIVRLSAEPDTIKAQVYFERALAVARQQQAKSWELRAAMSLARLWRDQGKVQDACELLAPVYGWFTEGFDTRDLRDAKALLAELA
jgi:predicted ATPase